MKKKLICLLVLSLCVFSGCTSAKQDVSWEKLPFSEHVKKAENTTVNFYAWGGSDLVNNYIDTFVAPRLMENYKITLNRVPITDVREMVQKLSNEKNANKETGSIDVLWINGENFQIAKESKLLLGSFTKLLPRFNALIDADDKALTHDFGVPTEGQEAPWGRSQFVFVYDSEKIPTPPNSMEKLKDFITENPGTFTYPEATDFTGSAFIRQTCLVLQKNANSFESGLSEDEIKAQAKPGMDFLKSLSPFLWREGKTYPESSGKLDQLYSSGEVWITMSYNPVHAQSMIESGQFPASSKTFVLEEGTLSNTHYLSIPYNAPNVSGALVAIDDMLSFESQIEKFKPSVWGDGTVLSSEKLDATQKERLASVDRGKATLNHETLSAHKRPEPLATYVDILETLWYEYVAK